MSVSSEVKAQKGPHTTNGSPKASPSSAGSSASSTVDSPAPTTMGSSPSAPSTASNAIKNCRSSVGLKRENWLAPFVVTKEAYMKEIVSMAEITENDVFYDVGCGGGEVIVYVAKHTKAKKIVGIEHNLDLCHSAIKQIRNKQCDSKRVLVKHADAMTASLSEASVVYLYLTIQGMKKFHPQLQKLLLTGVRVVSMWPLSGEQDGSEWREKSGIQQIVRHYNPNTNTFHNHKSHPFGLKIYRWKKVDKVETRC
ncbi:hypothetical protein AAMO2058_001237900 [Amorphochlora amoebiformis]